MLENEKSILGGIKGSVPEEKTYKVLKCFMRNEVSTSPIQSISFSPNVYHNIKGTKLQKYTLRSLTKFDQDTRKGKKGNDDDELRRKANKRRPMQIEKDIETQPVSVL